MDLLNQKLKIKSSWQWRRLVLTTFFVKTDFPFKCSPHFKLSRYIKMYFILHTESHSRKVQGMWLGSKSDQKSIPLATPSIYSLHPPRTLPSVRSMPHKLVMIAFPIACRNLSENTSTTATVANLPLHFLPSLFCSHSLNKSNLSRHFRPLLPVPSNTPFKCSR